MNKKGSRPVVWGLWMRGEGSEPILKHGALLPKGSSRTFGDSRMLFGVTVLRPGVLGFGEVRCMLVVIDCSMGCAIEGNIYKGTL